MSHHRETVTAADAPAPAGPYVHAVRAGGLLFCAGQIALDPVSGELVGDTPAEQAARCLGNLSLVCAAAGASLADAVKITVYLTDIAHMPEVNQVYADAFAGHELPARVGIAVVGLPRGALVELDAVVALP